MARDARTRPRSAHRGRMRWAPFVVLALAWPALLPTVGASFTDTSANGSSLAAAATFPTYPEQVVAAAPYAFYRLEEAASSSATPAVADDSGNARAGTVHGATDGPVTVWGFDEGTGVTSADLSGAVNPASLLATTWVGGVDGGALRLNGSSSQVVGANALDTTASFTVSGWANLSATGTERTVVAQDGAQVSGFGLHYDSGTDRWAFTMPVADSTGSAVTQAVGSSSPRTGRWYHLAGVYDAVAHELRLYVDGTLQGTVPFTSTWNATGALTAGRSRWGASMGWFAGDIDEVRAYQRALDATEVADLAGPQLRTRWEFSEGSGTTTADASTTGNSGTLSGATWTTSGHTGTALTFDGATSAVTGSAPIDTGSSYTATAWVNLATKSSWETAVSIDGTDISAFFLQYDVFNDRFGFAAHAADDRASASVRALSLAAPVTDRWYHLAGVHDSVAQTLTLYVDGVPQSTVAYASAWMATGPLAVGRARFDAADRDFFAGAIDGVRLYQRALTATEVSEVAADSAITVGLTEATATAGMTGALQGPLSGLGADTAMAFGGQANASYATPTAAFSRFTVETWFKVGTGQSGALVGFAADPTSAAATSDRALYLDANGHLAFAVDPGTPVTVTSPGTYDDGVWHHVAASLGPDGMRLHVDGALVASDAGTTSAVGGTGYWRVGGSPLTGFADRPASDLLVGSLDEVAIYGRQLSDSEVGEHAAADR